VPTASKKPNIVKKKPKSQTIVFDANCLKKSQICEIWGQISQSGNLETRSNKDYQLEQVHSYSYCCIVPIDDFLLALCDVA